jgi:hypothetical protein
MFVSEDETMKTIKQHRHLNWAEYVPPDGDSNAEVVAARLAFMTAVRRVFPQFLQELQNRVYPTYARLVELRQPYWNVGWAFKTWQLHSDRDNQLTPLLMG